MRHLVLSLAARPERQFVVGVRSRVWMEVVETLDDFIYLTLFNYGESSVVNIASPRFHFIIQLRHYGLFKINHEDVG